MTKNKLYSFLLLACFSGYLYLYYALFFVKKPSFGFCIIKNVTGFPCPSCGTTRAIELLLNKEFIQSILMNPFGIIVGFGMLVVPFWILMDLISKRETFYLAYKKTEKKIQTKGIAIFLIVLVVCNWIWNITKAL